MDLIWALLMILAGLILLICGLTRSEFIICRLLRARPKILLGETGAYVLLTMSGLIVIILGILFYFGFL